MGSPLLRGLVARLPDWLRPKAKWGCVVKVGRAGGMLYDVWACTRMHFMTPQRPTSLCPCPYPPQVSPEGEVLQTLMDPDGSHIASVSSVTEHQGRLFLGNLMGDYVSVLDLGAVAAAVAAAGAAAPGGS